MSKTPEVGYFLNDEEAELVEMVESGTTPFVSELTPERRLEIEAMARATVIGDQEKILLSISKADMRNLKARAALEGVSYQTLINSILQKYLAE